MIKTEDLHKNFLSFSVFNILACFYHALTYLKKKNCYTFHTVGSGSGFPPDLDPDPDLKKKSDPDPDLKDLDTSFLDTFLLTITKKFMFKNFLPLSFYILYLLIFFFSLPISLAQWLPAVSPPPPSLSLPHYHDFQYVFCP